MQVHLLYAVSIGLPGFVNRLKEANSALTYNGVNPLKLDLHFRYMSD